jgi:hypothetical protein
MNKKLHVYQKMATRKERKNVMRRRRQNGGASYVLAPAELTDMSMNGPMKASMAQGDDFFGYHRQQHGGMAPVGYTGVLDEALRLQARIAPLDNSISAIQGMRDQAGGRKARKTRKTRKAVASRKGRKAVASRKSVKGRKAVASRKGRKAGTARKARKMRGGMRALGFMDTNAPGMLLEGNQAAAANSTMNREWALAQNATSFAPKM